jgi:hypothetical protein
MMPSQFYDLLWIYCDNSNYTAIKNKHDSSAKELREKAE